MGATVTCNKSIAAFKNAAGKHFYLAFEETYEKNVYPHTPRWSCIAFGTYQDVLKRIFAYASGCEGGCLQTRSGMTTPELYLKGWQKVFEKPVLFCTEYPQKLRIEKYWNTPLPEESWEKAKQVFLNHDREDLVSILSTVGGEISLSLVDDTDLFIDLYGVNGVMSPWRIFSKHQCHTLANEDLRPTKPRGDFSNPKQQFLRYGENVFKLMPSNEWQEIGWDYSVVSDYIKSTACEAELASPGIGISLITAFRQQVSNAPKLPMNTKVQITVDPDDIQSYKVDYARKFANRNGFDENSDAFTVDFDQLHVNERAQVLYLDSKQLKWEIPVAEVSLPTISQPIIQSALAF